jgi:Pentapeptide repeats (8 copies)
VNNRWTAFGLFVLAALVAWIVVAYVPEIIAPTVSGATPSDEIKAVSDAQTAVVQLIGGAAVAFGLIFTARTYRLMRTGQLTDRFSKAVSQLSETEAVVRIGGIYALEQVAKESPETYSETVAEVLVAFVRGRRQGATNVEQSVQVALTVLGGPHISAAPGRLDLSGLDLRKVNLEGARLERARFTGTLLDGATLIDARLSESDLSKSVLDGANLSGADLRQANLVGASMVRAKLYAAKLEKAEVISNKIQEAEGIDPRQLAKVTRR